MADPSPETLHALEAVANAMADAAREAILPIFRSAALMTEDKGEGRFDPVTAADRAAEKAMRDILARERPQDAILGEEFGNTPGTSGFTWVLDPIDGTRAFLCGAPTWGVLIAVNAGAAPILGIVDQPWTGERFIGSARGARLESRFGPRPLATREPRPLSDAILLTTFPEIGTDGERRRFERVRDRVLLTRYGLDCYAYALIAAGQIDLVIEAGLAPYDIQACQALITAAGGVVTTWDGGPAEGGGRILAAANAEIHAEALALLSE
ncbi:MAG: histidinol-phosphatase [Rubricella sp.]